MPSPKPTGRHWSKYRKRIVDSGGLCDISLIFSKPGVEELGHFRTRCAGSNPSIQYGPPRFMNSYPGSTYESIKDILSRLAPTQKPFSVDLVSPHRSSRNLQQMISLEFTSSPLQNLITGLLAEFKSRNLNIIELKERSPDEVSKDPLRPRPKFIIAKKLSEREANKIFESAKEQHGLGSPNPTVVGLSLRFEPPRGDARSPADRAKIPEIEPLPVIEFQFEGVD
ncbi:hypothetical protein G7Y89_g14999 [Cudoniella acicularis]|uniref:Uncharacterized protein n=1 Tax=Cudoniella acicularis TaxID=354080 RepID=A0A8H4QV29_9HELO|nr:hypothetical protein G7Y89_g14999 [Cudoniella acicularis]